MNNQRPRLTASTPVDDFVSWYWLKKELQQFCREQGLSTGGSKQELQSRIATFLKTGRAGKTTYRPAPQKATRPNEEGLSLDAVIPTGFTCTREARDFLIAHAGKAFKYTVMLQRYLKANPGITFRQLITEWLRQTKLKKAGTKHDIDEQFEYNRFTRDYFADPKNHWKSRKDCIAAWYTVRNARGTRKYRLSE